MLWQTGMPYTHEAESDNPWSINRSKHFWQTESQNMVEVQPRFQENVLSTFKQFSKVNWQVLLIFTTSQILWITTGRLNQTAFQYLNENKKKALISEGTGFVFCFFEVGLVLVTEYKIKMKQTNKTVNLKETKIKLKNPREKKRHPCDWIQEHI